MSGEAQSTLVRVFQEFVTSCSKISLWAQIAIVRRLINSVNATCIIIDNYIPFISCDYFSATRLVRTICTSRTSRKWDPFDQTLSHRCKKGAGHKTRALWWTVLCMLFTSAQKSASRKQWYILVPLDGFPWFNYHSVARVALQYETGTRFFHWVVPELHNIKNQKIQHNHVVFFIVVS